MDWSSYKFLTHMDNAHIHSLKTVPAKTLRAWNQALDKSGLPGHGTILAFHLNQPDSEWAKPEEKHAVEDLLLRLAEMATDVKRIVPNPNMPARVAVKRINAREARQARQMEPINKILQRYTWIVQLVAWGREGPFFADFAWPSNSQGHSVTWTVAKLARMNVLDRMRKCAYGKCSKWFYATKPKKIYCSTKCQQEYNRSTPKSKQRSRKYHKKYYRDVLSPVTAKQTWRRKIGAAKGRKK